MTRRRFLMDLAFIGGALALAAGLGALEPEPPPPPGRPVADRHHPQYKSISEPLIGRP